MLIFKRHFVIVFRRGTTRGATRATFATSSSRGNFPWLARSRPAPRVQIAAVVRICVDCRCYCCSSSSTARTIVIILPTSSLRENVRESEERGVVGRDRERFSAGNLVSFEIGKPAYPQSAARAITNAQLQQMGHRPRAYSSTLSIDATAKERLDGEFPSAPRVVMGFHVRASIICPFIPLRVARACHLRVQGGCKWEATKEIALCHEGSLQTFFSRGVEKWQGQG